ncbi:hypothetical protein CLAFUW4_05047 [Fulvia fulva]|uniref:Uncharacterized protein n=1 Tax=Passalora fulva TaxID=5499 RepID=A0A9Q8PHM7_PASFU|nr:uncharacterized protein CLAFUR5_11860 [Fulvia fulva]KAK4626902.1 hypothetical protein CLAFUR4_05033 [Fulvia fulva]KAK4627608.1 hypothetical protein CLAFUR0_05037 [Fulvia fulva]UJO22577.1 hypothetical protein CLAFUR5_11860 [Fulvia fulva]WPV13965.1 hypothetical protein CLAFUW4_05047 [Fulvia fulva]WPV28374.1 hypothetical protein CLAFUW7_05041 [Fulvia fulva]
MTIAIASLSIVEREHKSQDFAHLFSSLLLITSIYSIPYYALYTTSKHDPMACKRKSESVAAAGPRKKQKTSTTTPPPKKTSPRLLTLPAEIRNRIYEYALIEHPNILITPAIREPPLLSANRQIRTEALGIYYSNLNIFILPIHSSDATLYLRWHTHLQSLGFDDMTSGLVRLSGTPRWENLFRWCKAVYQGGASMIRFKEDIRIKGQTTAMYHVVIAGLEIAKAGRESGLRWDVVEKLLGSLMYGVVEYDERWVEQ